MEKRLEELETEVNRFKTDIESLKTERKERSAALQQKLFGQFRMLNAKGEVKDLCTILSRLFRKYLPAVRVNVHYPSYCNMLIFII